MNNKILYLTSSPFGPLDQAYSVEGIDPHNGFDLLLKNDWPDDARILYISAFPDRPDVNGGIVWNTMDSLRAAGLSFDCIDMWQRDGHPHSSGILAYYNVIILGGGHVPTQNDFMAQIGLKKMLKDWKGLIIGISAGTMNSAETVYAQPEEPGESLDPDFERFIPGLGLTQINVVPHYQIVKNKILDGVRLFEDITYKDSFTHPLIALVDGSFIRCTENEEILYGEAYKIENGTLTQICTEGGKLDVSRGLY